VKLLFHDYGSSDDFPDIPDTTFTEAHVLENFLTQQSTRSMMGELECENGFKIDIAIDENLGMVQYFSIEGDPPYFMAVSPTKLVEGSHDFLISGEPSEIQGRFCLSLEVFKKVVMDFFQSGSRSDAVQWEET